MCGRKGGRGVTVQAPKKEQSPLMQLSLFGCLQPKFRAVEGSLFTQDRTWLSESSALQQSSFSFLAGRSILLPSFFLSALTMTCLAHYSVSSHWLNRIHQHCHYLLHPLTHTAIAFSCSPLSLPWPDNFSVQVQAIYHYHGKIKSGMKLLITRWISFSLHCVYLSAKHIDLGSEQEQRQGWAIARHLQRVINLSNCLIQLWIMLQIIFHEQKSIITYFSLVSEISEQVQYAWKYFTLK